MRFGVLCLVAFAVLPSLSRAQVPVFAISQEGSSVQFSVKASVALEGKFDKWEAAITFPSTDVTTGVTDIKIQAASVNTGSGMKDDKLRSKDFFNAKDDPYITFHSDKIVQTGPNTRKRPIAFSSRRTRFWIVSGFVLLADHPEGTSFVDTSASVCRY